MPDDLTTDTTADTGDQGGADDADTGAEQGQPQQGHHSQRQPRDDAQRFAKESKAAQQAAQNRFKRKVRRNGQEVEEEADLDELWRARDELARVKHLEKTSTERFQRASKLHQEAETARQVAQAIAKKDFSSLRGYFEQNKLDPQEALADLLDAAIQDGSMTPEQRELVQLRAEKEARDEADRRRQEDEEVASFYREVDQLRPEVEKVWQHALEQTGLPKTAKMMETTARIFLEAAEAGTHLSPEQVAEFARWELVEVNGGLINEMQPMEFVKHFAPVSEKINKAMSAEDFEKAWPDLAKRYHKLLFSRLRGGSAPSTRGATPAQPGSTRPASRPNGKSSNARVLADPFLDDLIR